MHAFLKLVAGLTLMGSVGSLEIDRIGFTQYFVQCALGVAKPYEIEIRKLKSARNALNSIIDRSASGKQAVVELKKFGFDYDTWAHSQVDIGGPSDFDILKRPKENDRISTGNTDTATSK